MRQPSTSPLTVSEFYAQTQGVTSAGRHRCHWCAWPCGEAFPHDDLRPQPGSPRNPFRAALPGEPFACLGCWLWRRKRITVRFLNGGWKDGQAPMTWSWLLTKDNARVIRKEDHATLLQFLVRPVLPFALLLLDGTGLNWPHLGVVNAGAAVEAATPLHFSLNGTILSYTVYELEEALRKGDPTGTEPGVQALVRVLGEVRTTCLLPPPLVPPPPPEGAKQKTGRPKALPDGKVLRELVKSGG